MAISLQPNALKLMFSSDQNVGMPGMGEKISIKVLNLNLEKCLYPGRLEPVNDFPEKNGTCATPRKKRQNLCPNTYNMSPVFCYVMSTLSIWSFSVVLMARNFKDIEPAA